MIIKKFLFLLLFSNFIFLSQAQDIQFTNLSNLPQERSAITSATNGENIYVANGFGWNAPFHSEIYQYNIASDNWSILTSSSIPKRFASAALVENKLYVFNGEIAGGILNNAVEVINLSDGNITMSTINPQPVRVAGVATWDGKIYSFGGTTEQNGNSDKIYEFDPQTEIWTAIATIPIDGQTKGEIINGKLFILGGYNGTPSNKIFIYDIATDTWEPEVTMSTSISAHATAVIGSTIYLVGDFTNLNSLASFETTNNTFTTLNSNLIDRRHCAAEGVNNQLIAIGGNTSSSGQSAISSVQVADILSSLEKIDSYSEFTLYPNPTKHLLNWDFQFESVIITDLRGRTIQAFNTPIHQLNVAQYPQGMYFLLGKSNGNWFRTKWVKN